MELRKYNDNKTRCESGINAEESGGGRDSVHVSIPRMYSRMHYTICNKEVGLLL